MRDAFIATIYELSKKNKDIMVLVADNGALVFDQFRRDFPKQFLNCGIAEANMMGFAAGLAAAGKKPFAYTISNFMTMRAFEQIRNDICLQRMNVKLVGIGGGFIYSTLGPTHHATEDVALMRALPNMVVICPASPLEVRFATQAIHALQGPVYLRLGTNGEPEIYEHAYDFRIGKGVELRSGTDCTIIVTGPLAHDVLIAHERLRKKGINVRVVNLHTIKPIDIALIIKAASETGGIITVENHSIIGGLGSAVAETLLEKCGGNIAFKRLGINDKYCSDYGSYDELKECYGLDWKAIVNSVELLLKRNDKREVLV